MRARIRYEQEIAAWYWEIRGHLFANAAYAVCGHTLTRREAREMVREFKSLANKYELLKER